MDNFDLLNKKELSYILNNEEKFNSQFILQIKDYCQRKRYSVNKIKEKFPLWKENEKRLNVELKNDEILISKTEEAKRDEISKYTFGIIIIGIILVFGIWTVFFDKKSNLDFWYTIIVSPFVIALFIGLIIKRKETKIKSKQEKVIKILASLKVKIFDNGAFLDENQIKAINLFWTDDNEAGSFPKATLELKITDRSAILIDEDGNYLELLRKGNEIANFLNKKLNVFHGNSQLSYKIEL